MVLAIAAFLVPRGAAQTACEGSTGPDVIVADITGPQNYSATGGYEALSLGTYSCNMGTQNVGWQANTNQHPVIGGELYRYKVVGGAGRFEQVGQSWLKHAFFALSNQLCCSGCQGDPNGTFLGVRCSDPYTAARNGTQAGLGPRYQVNAHTGIFTYPPPHPSGGNTGRLEVALGDLEATGSGTRYFGNAQYVAPDDAASNNHNNNSSYREVTVSGGGSAFTFGFSGATEREKAAILAWQACEAGVTIDNVQIPSEGLLIVGHKATDLGGGQWHYEYAVHNMNSDASVRSFSIPLNPSVVVTNMGFHDVEYRGGDGIGGINFDGTDWAGTTTASAASTSTVRTGRGRRRAGRWRGRPRRSPRTRTRTRSAGARPTTSGSTPTPRR